MNDKVKEKIQNFLDNATGESILDECKEFGIELEDVSSIESILKDFVSWLSQKDDVFYVFDNPDEVINEYLSEK